MILGWVDRLIDQVTMYRLLVYYLVGLLLSAIGLSAADYLPFKAWEILISVGVILAVCYSTNRVFCLIFKKPYNPESTIITALILALVINPPRQADDLIFPVIASVLAISSKYLLAIRGKHIFNPAAIGLVITAIVTDYAASWWVGNKYLLPIVLVGGLLLVRKIEREYMVITFLVAMCLATTIFAVVDDFSLWLNIKNLFLSSGLLFMAFVMLTEPATSPTTRNKQIAYGGLAGLLFPPQVNVFGFYSTPERVLAVANIFTYLTGAKRNVLAKLEIKTKISKSVTEFVFQTKHLPVYKPGQYMEWTITHKGADSRGYRRYFTLASSPTEDDLKIGVKFYEPGSSYKKALASLNSESQVAAGQVSGNFVMPDDKSKKLVFIAGGIGVTPYRSMIKYLTDKQEKRDVVLMYSEKSQNDLAYTDIFGQASKIGLKNIYILSEPPKNWKGANGRVSADLIKKQIPDYKERLFYISGPHSMVEAIKQQLKELGIPRSQIKIDFFPGYA